MRQILVDSARREASLKRGGNLQRVALDMVEQTVDSPSPEDVLAVSEALELLAEHDADKAELVKLRYFAGLSARLLPFS